LVSETLNESIYLIVVMVARKFQELTNKCVAPFGLFGKKQGAAFNEVCLINHARLARLVFRCPSTLSVDLGSRLASGAA
jgi:hypothetical protein